jgi:hypothetical protein
MKAHGRSPWASSVVDWPSARRGDGLCSAAPTDRGVEPEAAMKKVAGVGLILGAAVAMWVGATPGSSDAAG